MELVYIARAIRRYWWVTLLGALVGLVAGLALGGGSSKSYSTQAEVLISSPAEGGLGATSNDRYVQNQLLVFESGAVSSRVAQIVDAPAAELAASTATFEQAAGSDFVRISVSAPDPELARSIANAYVDAYLEAVREQLDGAQAPNLDSINDALEEIRVALADVDDRIEAALAPFIQAGGSDAALPIIEQVSPTLATERQVLIDQYLDLLTTRNQLALGAQTRVTTQVVQRATLPTIADPESMSILLLAGPVAGILLGGLVSVVLARASSRVLDADEVETILNAPVAGVLPKMRRLTQPRDLGHAVPDEIRTTIHELCVSADASKTDRTPLTVVVTSADRSGGSTTVALAMAQHFASNGTEVLLLDVDAQHPELTDLAGEGVSGIRMLLEDVVSTPSGRTDRNRKVRPFIRTVHPGLHFAGLGDSADGQGVQRQDAEKLLQRAAEQASVVVVDAGTLMDASSNVQLALVADVTVLTVPSRRQRRSALEVAARQLRTAEASVLPVLTPASPRSDRHRAPQPRSASSVPAAESTEVHDVPARLSGG